MDINNNIDIGRERKTVERRKTVYLKLNNKINKIKLGKRIKRTRVRINTTIRYEYALLFLLM